MKLSLFDLHCDTASELFLTGQDLRRNSLAVSLEHAAPFEQYVQVMAVFPARRLCDEDGWQYTLDVIDRFLNDPDVRNGTVKQNVTCPERENGVSFFFGIEDARVLNRRIERVDELRRRGVQIFIPVWAGVNCLGGAHDTDTGLSAFGKEAVRRAIRLGMIADVSHSSVASAEEIFRIAEEENRPVIASHSNAYEVCPVSRNLRDEQIAAILRSGGVIGLNLYTAFLRKDRAAHLCDALRHIEHFAAQGALDALCLGCDMDGADLPEEIPDLSALPALAELLLRENYSEDTVRAIFFENAFRFAEHAFPKI